MRFRIIPLIIVLAVAVVGCGSSGSELDDKKYVSIDEYNKVVDERDYYKEQYEKVTSAEAEEAEEAEEAASEEYSGEITMIVDITKDNLSDYFEYVLAESDSSDATSGEKYYKYVPESKVFDEGWVYIKTSDDFNISYVTDSSWDESFGYYTCSRIEPLRFLYKSTDESEVRILDAQGQIMFQRIEALQKYELDSFNLKRIVIDADGNSYRDDIYRSQLEIQY